MENKYYTPDIEDIRVGYECEWGDSRHQLDIFDLDNACIDIKNIKVPYLTKEQIEAEGWKNIIAPSFVLAFEKGEYSMEFVNGNILEDKICHIGIWQRGLNTKSIKYIGYCPSINEFRYITRKLLKIN